MFVAGLWFLYGGYQRRLSLAGRTETGLTYLRTGLDGKTRVLTHHWHYGIGAVLLIGSTWWLVKGDGKRKRRR